MSSVPPKFNGYAALNAEEGKQSRVQPHEFEPPALGDDDVTVKVECCGVCFSDLHVMHQDWAKTKFPFVGGHEVVGKVAELGKRVKGLEVGQRVGVGWISGACRACGRCIRAKDEFCENKEETIIGRHGGFADYIRVNAHYAFPIPDNLKSEDAAPLMCAGITVFTPLKHYGVKPFHRVGIVGMGGLGHLAVQFAAAMGCEVTVFSHSPKKQDEAKEFGARHFVSTEDEETMKKSKNSQDFILVTTDKMDEETFAKLLACLDIDGKICVVGDMSAKLTFSANIIALNRLSVCGSIVGGQVDMQDMLQFVATHNVRPKINEYPMDQINDALQAAEAGKARYRIVLKRGQ